MQTNTNRLEVPHHSRYRDIRGLQSPGNYGTDKDESPSFPSNLTTPNHSNNNNNNNRRINERKIDYQIPTQDPSLNSNTSNTSNSSDSGQITPYTKRFNKKNNLSIRLNGSLINNNNNNNNNSLRPPLLNLNLNSFDNNYSSPSIISSYASSDSDSITNVSNKNLKKNNKKPQYRTLQKNEGILNFKYVAALVYTIIVCLVSKIKDSIAIKKILHPIFFLTVLTLLLYYYSNIILDFMLPFLALFIPLDLKRIEKPNLLFNQPNDPWFIKP